MKKKTYNMTATSKSGWIFIVATIIELAITYAIFIITIKDTPISEGIIAIIFMAILGSLFLIIGIINIVSAKRIKMVKENGIRKTGSVDRYTTIRINNRMYKQIYVSYKTESGLEAVSICRALEEKIPDVFDGSSVPILVYNEWAIIDESRLGRDIQFEHIDNCKNEGVCDSCGAKIGLGLIYCPKCGKAVEDMYGGCDHSDHHDHSNFCPSCGNIIDKDTIFCTKCGYKVN